PSPVLRAPAGTPPHAGLRDRGRPATAGWRPPGDGRRSRFDGEDAPVAAPTSRAADDSNGTNLYHLDGGMEYRTFGRTGMRVSVLGLGCGGFGGVGSAPELFGKGEDKKTAFALMDRAWEAGINYFDTADSYGGGISETIVGAWIKERKVRDQLILSTKVGYALAEGPQDQGLSCQHLAPAIEASL